MTCVKFGLVVLNLVRENTNGLTVHRSITKAGRMVNRQFIHPNVEEYNQLNYI